MLVDYREFFFFFSQCLYLYTDAKIHKVYTQQDTTKLAQRHAVAQAILTITVMSSKWQTIQGFAVPGSKAGLQLSTKDSDNGFWDIFSFFSLSILLSLYLPPPIFHSFSIRSSLSPGITNTSAGGRITDKSPGVLDSATLAGARHILACPTSCHIGLKNQTHTAAQFKHNTEEPTWPPVTYTHTHLRIKGMKCVIVRFITCLLYQ